MHSVSHAVLQVAKTPTFHNLQPTVTNNAIGGVFFIRCQAFSGRISPHCSDSRYYVGQLFCTKPFLTTTKDRGTIFQEIVLLCGVAIVLIFAKLSAPSPLFSHHPNHGFIHSLLLYCLLSLGFFLRCNCL